MQQPIGRMLVFVRVSSWFHGPFIARGYFSRIKAKRPAFAMRYAETVYHDEATFC